MKPSLAAEGKTVVWIDGGLHATEVLGAQQLMELVYQLVSRSDDETMRFLEDTIVLATCVNPDGMELVSNWYMRNPVPEERSTSSLPRLYQKYTGHDNNRDFYMSSQPESEAINRILYREWFPQIVYNHHQTGPRGTVMFAPPFRGSFQLQLRSTGRHEPGPGGRCDAQPLPRRRQTGYDDAFGCDLLDVVERWVAHESIFPQHDWALDRNDR